MGVGDAGSDMALDTDITLWGGTMVTPGGPAYDKEQHEKDSAALADSDTKKVATTDVKMETA